MSYRIPLIFLRGPICTVGTTGTIWGGIFICRGGVSCFDVVSYVHPIDTNIVLTHCIYTTGCVS